MPPLIDLSNLNTPWIAKYIEQQEQEQEQPQPPPKINVGGASTHVAVKPLKKVEKTIPTNINVTTTNGVGSIVLTKEQQELKNKLENGENKKKETKSKPVGGDSANAGDKLGLISSGINAGMNMLTPMIPVQEDTSFHEQQAIGDSLMQSGNPAAMIAGAAYKALSAFDQFAGTAINKLNDTQANAAGISKGEQILNNMASYVPLVGALAGNTANAERSLEIDNVASAYSGSASDIDTAGTMGGKTYLVGKKKANQFIAQQNESNKILTDLSMTNTLRKSTDAAFDYNAQNYKKLNGINYQGPNMALGKQGLKLLSKEDCQKILALKDAIQAFADGGKVGIDSNVLPEGSLHAHKNHIEEVNSELDDVTKKGIPVIITDQNCEHTQVAEIEREEWIARLEVTKRLEELWQDGSEVAMIEAGKLVAEELMTNTIDNTDKEEDK